MSALKLTLAFISVSFFAFAQNNTVTPKPVSHQLVKEMPVKRPIYLPKKTIETVPQKPEETQAVQQPQTPEEVKASTEPKRPEEIKPIEEPKAPQEIKRVEEPKKPRQ